MTEEKLTDAITELDEDVLQRYYAMKQSLTEKKQKKPTLLASHQRKTTARLSATMP